MDLDRLFDLMDLDRDGVLTRAEVGRAALRLGWHWPQAPLLAVLDRLTIFGPLDCRTFTSLMEQILADPQGPYGKVLLRAPLPAGTCLPVDELCGQHGLPAPESLAEALKRLAGPEAAARYEGLLAHLQPRTLHIACSGAALLVIDPQRSFTRGAWMRSAGPRAEQEVWPIRLAFERCGRLLLHRPPGLEVVFSRCPFPPDSYGWDPGVEPGVDPCEPYFIKPGNSVLWPPTNGFGDWVQGLLGRGRRVLVMAGCTLNSCVRISAVDTCCAFAALGLQVVVDLGLCGARTSNYLAAAEFGGRSSVEAAIQEMIRAGVQVVAGVSWSG